MKIHYANCTLHSPHAIETDICIKLIMLHFELHSDRSSSQQPYFATRTRSFLVRIGHQIEMDFGIMMLSEITAPLLGCIYGCNIVKGEVRDEIKGPY